MQVYLKSLNFMNNYDALSDLSNLYRVVQLFSVKKKRHQIINTFQAMDSSHFVNFTSIAVFTLK